jgi:hypothetical protein
MNLPTEQQLSKWLVRVVAFLLSASPPAAVLWAGDSLAEHLKAIPPLRVVQAAAMLLAVTFFLIAYVVLQRPWLRWDEPTGTWINRLNCIRFCGTCRAKNVFVPLKNEITGWRCVACDNFRVDPERKRPKQLSPATTPSGPHGWMG